MASFEIVRVLLSFVGIVLIAKRSSRCGVRIPFRVSASGTTGVRYVVFLEKRQQPVVVGY